ncbi:hypothetical protein LP420_10750 [Massilia sp. B-10]|nr:hypothetical protein LP420_10750 [Massilia sp. B-10]
MRRPPPPLTGKGMLGNGDPANVVYSFTLMERGENVNYLRVQTDNYDQPLDINEGAKLDLGSTAKLRTLVTYLDIVDQLHKRFEPMEAAELKKSWSIPRTCCRNGASPTSRTCPRKPTAA